MNEENQTQTPPETSLVGMFQGAIDKVKGPIFWLAVGYIACKITDRKAKQPRLPA
jgi:hypothetical protein